MAGSVPPPGRQLDAAPASTTAAPGFAPWFAKSASVKAAASANAARQALSKKNSSRLSTPVELELVAFVFAFAAFFRLIDASPNRDERLAANGSFSRERLRWMVTRNTAPASFFSVTASPGSSCWSSTNPRQLPARLAPAAELWPTDHVHRQDSPSHTSASDRAVGGRKSARPAGAGRRPSEPTCFGKMILTNAGPAGESPRPPRSTAGSENESLDASSFSHDHGAHDASAFDAGDEGARALDRSDSRRDEATTAAVDAGMTTRDGRATLMTPCSCMRRMFAWTFLLPSASYARMAASRRASSSDIAAVRLHSGREHDVICFPAKQAEKTPHFLRLTRSRSGFDRPSISSRRFIANSRSASTCSERAKNVGRDNRRADSKAHTR